MSNTTHTPVTPEYLDELEALSKGPMLSGAELVDFWHNALPALIAEVRRLNTALAEQTARAEKAEAERDELEEWGCKLVYEITDGRLSKCYDVDVVEDEVSFQWQKYVDSKVAETQAESAKWERIARWLAGQLQDLNTGATANDLIHHAQSEIEKERGE